MTKLPAGAAASDMSYSDELERERRQSRNSARQPALRKRFGQGLRVGAV